VPDDDPVARDALGAHAERGGPVAHERVELDERALVEQGGDALPRGLLAPRVLARGRVLLGGVDGGLPPVREVRELGRGARGRRRGGGAGRPDLRA